MLKRGVTMTSNRKILLGTAAATIAVTGGVDTGAQAADAAIKKAPPIQYVRICDRYGAGFFQIPGSAICLQLRGQFQSDNDYQPTRDLMFMTPSKTTGSYGGSKFTTMVNGGAANGNVQFANQQDNWGYEVTAKPRFDARTETSMGTIRAFVDIKIALDAGAFNGPPGPGAGETGAGNKSELFRGFVQWAGWTIGNADSIFSNGGFKIGEMADVTTGDKISGWVVNYTWTPSGPGVPPVKGSAPVPDGWSFALEMLSPLKTIAKNQIGGGCTYADVNIVAGNPAVGAGSVCAATGPLSVPDVTARVQYQADPPGKDPQHNDQFGLGAIHLAGAYHQITQIAVGGIDAPGNPTIIPGACGVTGTCAAGPVNHDHGWAGNAGVQFFVPMWPGTTIGSRRGSNADNLWFSVLYCDGALAYCGLGGSNGNLSVGDAYWVGGFSRDDEDGRLVNNGMGGFFDDKAKALAVNAQYVWALTNCDDPVHCLVATLEFNHAWITPGNITQNVDWTGGGLGKARKMDLTAEVSWGVSRNGTTKPTFWRVDFEAQYRKLWQDLPNNCNGGGPGGVCFAPTALPVGINKDPSNWVWRTTLSFDW
jgi:hypothetical protein